MKLMNRSKLPYPVEETEQQISQIAELTKLRKACGRNVEVERYNDSIAIAQEVLLFMQEENQRFSRHKELRRKPIRKGGK